MYEFRRAILSVSCSEIPLLNANSADPDQIPHSAVWSPLLCWLIESFFLHFQILQWIGQIMLCGGQRKTGGSQDLVQH